MNQRLKIVARCLGLVLLFSVAELLAPAQTQNPQTSSLDATQTQNQAQPNQANPIPDLGPLNLTPDQVQKIKIIYADTKDQRQAVSLRVRQAQRSLAEAIEASTPNEPVIEQRSHDLADARADAARLRSLTEARILHEVLTPEQRVRLREMRQRAQANQRARNQQGPRNQNGLPRNPNAPQTLKPNQRKQMKQQQKP
jgi:Spy/CpxP family protein refolding chaperone